MSTSSKDCAPSMSRLVQERAVQIRNIANMERLEVWISQIASEVLGDQAPWQESSEQSKRANKSAHWLRSVGRNWMSKNGQAFVYHPAPEDLAKAPSWVVAAAEKGTPMQALSLTGEERDLLAGVVDWLRSEDGPALRSDWSKISVPQAERAEKGWIQKMAKDAAKRDLEAAEAQGTRGFVDIEGAGPDGTPGWRWVEVLSKDSLDREGALMRHCVGSYSEEVAAGGRQIYSLRDGSNTPKLTLEARKGELSQLKAFANKPCPSELRAAVAVFAAAFAAHCEVQGMELSVGQEMNKSGAIHLPGAGVGFVGERLSDAMKSRIKEGVAKGQLSADELMPGLCALNQAELVGVAMQRAGAGALRLGLEQAAQRGYVALVEALIAHSGPKAEHSAALQRAAHHGHAEVVQMLIPHSDPKAENSAALQRAAHRGHAQVVQMLIPHSDPKEQNSLALQWAALHGHAEVVQMLIPHSDPKAENSAALQRAALHGHAKVVKLLIPHSDPKAENSTALQLAAKNGHVEVVKALLPHSDPKAKNSEALQLAAKSGHVEVVKMLIPHSAPKEQGSWPLQWAALHGHVEVVQMLIPHSDPKAENSGALQWAAFHGHMDVVKILLPHSEISMEHVSMAESKDHEAIAAILVQEQARRQRARPGELGSLEEKLASRRRDPARLRDGMGASSPSSL
jgi:ankyrin repeat protein